MHILLGHCVIIQSICEPCFISIHKHPYSGDLYFQFEALGISLAALQLSRQDAAQNVTFSTANNQYWDGRRLILKHCCSVVRVCCPC